MNSPVVVRRWRALSSRAMPKSVTFTSPEGRTTTLAGLTSRCTTPWRWAWWSARATCATSRSTVRQSRGPAPRQVGEGLAPQQLERDEERAGGRVAAHVVDDDDARVLQGGRDAGLGQEALLEDPRRLPLAGRLDDLQGDGPVEDRVARLVDDPHGAATDLAEDLVPADRGGRLDLRGDCCTRLGGTARLPARRACSCPTRRFCSVSMAASSCRTAAAVSGRGPISRAVSRYW